MKRLSVGHLGINRIWHDKFGDANKSSSKTDEINGVKIDKGYRKQSEA